MPCQCDFASNHRPSLLVEGRLYDESMAGATGKSNPGATKLDHKELARLQRQDYWIQVTRLKLIMDLVFVCTLHSSYDAHASSSPCHSVRHLRAEAFKRSSANICRPHIGHSLVRPTLPVTSCCGLILTALASKTVLQSFMTAIKRP